MSPVIDLASPQRNCAWRAEQGFIPWDRSMQAKTWCPQLPLLFYRQRLLLLFTPTLFTSFFYWINASVSDRYFHFQTWRTVPRSNRQCSVLTANGRHHDPGSAFDLTAVCIAYELTQTNSIGYGNEMPGSEEYMVATFSLYKSIFLKQLL